MIKKLRFKLIGVSMLSLFLVLAAILGTVNILNYRQVVSDAEQVLAILADNDGVFPTTDPASNTDGSSDPPAKPEGDDDALPENAAPAQSDSAQPFGEGAEQRQMSPEAPYESRYFSVRVSGEGTVGATDTSQIAAVDEAEAVEMAQSVLEKGKASGFWGNYRYRVVSTDGETLVIFLDCQKNLSTFRSFLLYSGLTALLGMAAVFVLITLCSRKIIRPVAESYEKQKRFITDAGHEIKTPLTIIDADAAVLELDLGEENEWLHDIQAQTRRLTELTNDLIFLSRMEEGGQAFQPIPFPVSDVAEEAAQSFLVVAKARNKTLSLSVQPDLTLTGDEKAVRQLCSLLLDNALKYAPEGDEIVFSLSQQGRGVRLSVQNAAPELNKEQTLRMFDRFYRADRSRNSSTGGYGIGLSIAKAIVQAHRGKISAALDGEKLVVTALLP